jgi:hypothetical protein
VEQLSLPYRIALIALVVVGGLWFVVLRPKSGGEATTPPATTAPGVTGLKNDVDKAKGAVATSNAAAAGSEAAANAVGGSGTTSTPATGAATPAAPSSSAPRAAKPVAKPGLAADAAPGDPSRPLLADVDNGKVAVVLFWNKAGSDDRATRVALRAVDRHHGKVVTKAIPVGQVGKYEAITRGAQILESPTVLVIGAGGKAQAITGYTEAVEIDQAISDIGGKGFQAAQAFHLKGFAKVADNVCKDFQYAVKEKADPPNTVSELADALGVAAREQSRSIATLTKTKATSAGERALKSSMIAFAHKDQGWVKDAQRKLKSGGDPSAIFLGLAAAESKGDNAYKAAARKVHATGCYVQS